MSPAMHKRYYTAADVDSLEEQSLLDEDEDELTMSPTHRNENRHTKMKCLFILPFILFFALLYIPLFHSVSRHRSVALPGWWSNVSRDLKMYIEPDKNTSVIEPSNICDTRDKIFVLVVVCSAVANFEARDSIRETWGNTSGFNYPVFHAMHALQRGSFLEGNRKNWSNFVIDGARNMTEANFNVKVLFLVGQTKPKAYSSEYPDEQTKIQSESDTYGDLLQEGFLDTYNNLTLKTAMLLKWVTNNCEDNVKYVLKVDDDTFINLPNLLHVLLGGTIPVYNATIGFHDRDSILVKKSKNRLPNTKNLLLGHLFCGVKPVADTSSKWYTPYYLFSGDYYPGYLSGTAYLMSMPVARQLYNVSLSTPYFHLEDVYLTGICASKIKLKRTHHPLFFYSTVKDRDKSYCSLRGMISQHQLTSGDMKTAFDAITNQNVKCSVPTKNSLSSKLKLQMKKKCH